MPHITHTTKQNCVSLQALCHPIPLLQGFTFEDPGGWCTTAYFDLTPLAHNANLRHLDLQLVTWECEHCESFELSALSSLTQLHSLNLCVATPTASAGSAGGSSSNSTDSSSEGPELLLVLPLLKPARRVTICSSMRVVLRNSKVLARARAPGVLAQCILLEEPLPQRTAASSSNTAAGNSAQQGSDTAGAARDQGSNGGASATAAPNSAASAAGALTQPMQQYVRAPAHVVISALRELWPNMEVWQDTLKLPSSRGPKGIEAELCCHSTARHMMQRDLTAALTAAVAGLVDETGKTSSSGFCLW